MTRRKSTAASAPQRLSTSRRPRSSTTLAGGCLRASPGPNEGLGFGVSPTAIWNLRLYLYPVRGYVTDPKAGKVYGRLGKVVGGVGPDGYMRTGRVQPGDEQYIHRFIWSSVHGDIPPGMCIDHKNGQRADNRIANLRLVTPAQNAHYACLRGSIATGEDKPNAVLTAKLVQSIRASQKSNKDWAAELGVAATTVRDARSGKSWRHVRPCPRMRAKRRPRTR